MRALLILLLSAVVSTSLVAQKPCALPKSPLEIQISSEIAKGLLMHTEAPICQHVVMGARVSGTAVFAILISKDGRVISAHKISGPQMLVAPALKAVRQYRYTPYTVCGKPVDVETMVSVPMTCPE